MGKKFLFKKIPYLGMFVFLCNGLIAQVDTKKEEAAIKNVVESYIKAYGALPQTKDKLSVLQMCSPDLTSSIYYFGIMGSPRVTQSDYSGLEKHLDKLLQTEGIFVKYELKSIPWMNVKENYAGAMYTVDYEIKEPEGIWVKGSEAVSLGLKKYGDNWKIVRLSVIGFDDERLKGICLTEIFTSDTQKDEMIAKTIVPSGQSYTTHLNAFQFTGTGDGTLIRSEANIFKWVRNTNEIFGVNDATKEQVLLGKAEMRKEIVSLILKNGLFPDACSSIKAK